MIELGAAWVDDQGVAQAFRKDLMRMPDDQDIVTESYQTLGPVLPLLGDDLAMFVQQSDSVQAGLWRTRVYHVQTSARDGRFDDSW